MPLKVILTTRASQELVAFARHIAQDNLDAALRFLDAAEATKDQLALDPELGTAIPTDKYPQLRRWPITGFNHYLYFYESSAEQVIVVRVLHSSRDLPGVLES